MGSEINMYCQEGICSPPGGLQLPVQKSHREPPPDHTQYRAISHVQNELNIFNFEHLFLLSLDLENSMNFVRENGTDSLGSLLLEITILYITPQKNRQCKKSTLFSHLFPMPNILNCYFKNSEI